MVFKLIRTDSETPQKIKLPQGTHLLGRGGNILECTDKRISRNHGNLTVTIDKLILKSLHLNPCYYIKKNVSETQILKQDCELNLNHGDRFGLLPDSYWYEVLLCTNIEEESQNKAPNSVNIDHDIKLNDNSNTEDYTQNDNDKDSTGSQSLLATEEHLLNDITNSPEVGNLVQNTSVDTSTENENHIPDGQDLEEQNARTPKRSNSDTENYVEEKKVKLEEEDVKPSIVPGCSNDQAADNATPIVQPAQQGRERCIYGASCYRRNPLHLAEFSHPSDADWGGGDRGECPWGSRCRRRDPRHWIHHNHPPGTQPPRGPNQPGRATKRPKTKPTMKKDSSDSDSLSQDLIVTGKRKRKPIMLSTDWKASDDEGEEDPFQTDESDEWQPNDSTQSQSLGFSQDYD